MGGRTSLTTAEVLSSCEDMLRAGIGGGELVWEMMTTCKRKIEITQKEIECTRDVQIRFPQKSGGILSKTGGG